MKKNHLTHLVFYDGECGFCDRSVQLLLKFDKNKLFVFAPLQGKTADKFLKNIDPDLRDVDTLILVEDYRSSNPKIFIFGKAVFRILWLLGGFWTLIGWISFLPSFLYDWGYRLVAKNRKYFHFDQSCPLPSAKEKDRFLP